MPLIDPGDGSAARWYADWAEDCIEPQFVQNAGRLRRLVKLEWEDLETAIKGFIGYCQIRTQGGVRYYHRHVPDSFPRFYGLTGRPTLFCVSAGPAQGVRAVGKHQDETQQFVWARLPLEYRTVPYGILPDEDVLGLLEPFGGIPDESTGLRYVTPHFDGAPKIIALPQGMMQMASATAALRVPIRQGLPIRRAAGTFTLTHHLLPALPITTIQAAENRINSTEFFDFPAETLLFSNWRYRRERSPLGDFVFTVDFIFDYLPNWSPIDGTPKGHNRILRKMKTAIGPPAVYTFDYHLATTDGTVDDTKAMFRQFDMHELLRPDQP